MICMYIYSSTLIFMRKSIYVHINDRFSMPQFIQVLACDLAIRFKLSPGVVKTLRNTFEIFQIIFEAFEEVFKFTPVDRWAHVHKYMCVCVYVYARSPASKVMFVHTMYVFWYRMHDWISLHALNRASHGLSLCMKRSTWHACSQQIQPSHHSRSSHITC